MHGPAPGASLADECLCADAAASTPCGPAEPSRKALKPSSQVEPGKNWHRTILSYSTTPLSNSNIQATNAECTCDMCGRPSGHDMRHSLVKSLHCVRKGALSGHGSRPVRECKEFASWEARGCTPVVAKCASKPKEYTSELSEGALYICCTSGAIHSRVPPNGSGLPTSRRESPKSNKEAFGMVLAWRATRILPLFKSPCTMAGSIVCKYFSAELTSSKTLPRNTSFFGDVSRAWTFCTYSVIVPPLMTSKTMATLPLSGSMVAP
mmetsp:Transcript_26120/g.75398  ORF Transcript_26120/g.75398 Transcript_26120/m.75398 type:complete len:265 (+) Transcript_26120:332-1126(+)